MNDREREQAGRSASAADDAKTEESASTDERARMQHYRRALQRKASGAQVREGADQALTRADSSTGAVLPSQLKQRFERATGADLSGVRVHTSEGSARAAEAVGARAYTTGPDVHFARGEYDPSTRGGQELLAHEVAHTIQQSRGAAGLQLKPEKSGDTGDADERQADDAAKKMVGDDGALERPSGSPDGDRSKKGGDAARKGDAPRADGDHAKGKELMPPLFEPGPWMKNPIVAPFGPEMDMGEVIADAYLKPVLFSSKSVGTVIEDAKRTFGAMRSRFSGMLSQIVPAWNKLKEAIAKAEEEDKKNPSPSQAAVISDAKTWESHLYWSSIVRFGMGKCPPRVHAEVGTVSKMVILSESWDKAPQEILAQFV